MEHTGGGREEDVEIREDGAGRREVGGGDSVGGSSVHACSKPCVRGRASCSRFVKHT